MAGDIQPSTKPRALLITGGIASGKTSVAIEIGELLERSNHFYAVIDLDFLCWAKPDPHCGTSVNQLLVRNLVPVVQGFRDSGIDWFVLPRLIVNPDEFELLRDALATVGVDDLTVIELTVANAIALRRLQSRDTGANLQANLEDSVRLDSVAAIAGATFATDAAPIDEVARDVLAHWLSASP
jgi:hypothetical protein